MAVAGGENDNGIHPQPGAIILGIGNLLEHGDAMVVQEAVVMIRQSGVLNIDNQPVFRVFGKQVKPAVDQADGRVEGFFGLDPVDFQVQAEEVLDEGFEDVGPGKGLFEDDSITQ